MLATPQVAGFAPDRTFFVALKGGDADNIADALTKVNGLTPAPSAANPAAIMVFPGVYSTPPFTIPAGVTILGAVTEVPVILEASTTTAQLATATAAGSLANITLRGADGVGGIGIGYRAGAAGIFKLRHVIVDDCETGVYSDGAGREIRVDDVACFGCLNSFRVGTNGGIIQGYQAYAENDVAAAEHLLVEAASGIVNLANSWLRDDRFNTDPAATINVFHASPTPGEESFRLLGELQVGSEYRPRESAFGGGDSHTRHMAVYTNTNLEAGTWADITSSLILEDASSVNLFPGVGAGNCLYVGGDVKFPGLKLAMTTAMALGTGSVVAEYWNGSAWVAFAHMSTDSDAPYDQYGRVIFERVNSEQVRFDTAPLVTWATKALNGTTKYWMRVRVVTAITTIPACDKMKLHTHRTEINGDGVVEHFGDAEPVRELLWHRNLEDLWDGNDPGDYKVLVASGVTIKIIDNKFQDGGKDGKIGMVRVGPGLDTSRDLVFTIHWHPQPGTTLTGFVEWQLDGYVFKQGDLFDGTKTPVFQKSVIVDMTTFASSYEYRRTAIPIQLPDRVPGDLLVFHLYRDASPANADDTYQEDVEMLNTSLDGVFWR